MQYTKKETVGTASDGEIHATKAFISTIVYDHTLGMPLCRSRKCGYAIPHGNLRKHLTRVHDMSPPEKDKISDLVDSQKTASSSVAYDAVLRNKYLATTHGHARQLEALPLHPRLRTVPAWMCAVCQDVFPFYPGHRAPRHECRANPAGLGDSIKPTVADDTAETALEAAPADADTPGEGDVQRPIGDASYDAIRPAEAPQSHATSTATEQARSRADASACVTPQLTRVDAQSVLGGNQKRLFRVQKNTSSPSKFPVMLRIRNQYARSDGGQRDAAFATQLCERDRAVYTDAAAPAATEIVHTHNVNDGDNRNDDDADADDDDDDDGTHNANETRQIADALVRMVFAKQSVTDDALDGSRRTADVDPVHAELQTEKILQKNKLDMPAATRLTRPANDSEHAYHLGLMDAYVTAAYNEAAGNSFIKSHSILGSTVKVVLGDTAITAYKSRAAPLLSYTVNACTAGAVGELVSHLFTDAQKQAVETLRDMSTVNTSNPSTWPQVELDAALDAVHTILHDLFFVASTPLNEQMPLYIAARSVHPLNNKNTHKSNKRHASGELKQERAPSAFYMLDSKRITHIMSPILYLLRCFAVRYVYIHTGARISSAAAPAPPGAARDVCHTNAGTRAPQTFPHSSPDSQSAAINATGAGHPAETRTTVASDTDKADVTERRWDYIRRMTSQSKENGIRYTRFALSLAHGINQSLPNAQDRFNVCPDHAQCAFVDDTEVSVSAISAVITQLQQRAWELLDDYLLLGLTLRGEFWKDVSSMSDAMRVSLPNYWFGCHGQNAEQARTCTTRILQATANSYLRPSFVIPQAPPAPCEDNRPSTLRFPPDASKQYLKHCDELHEIIFTLVHLTSGSPARATEWQTLKLQNTSRLMRNVFFTSGGLLTLVTTYHKSQSLQDGKVKWIARFPCAVTSGIIVVKELLVRPLEQLLRNEVYGTPVPERPDETAGAPNVTHNPFVFHTRNTEASAVQLRYWFAKHMQQCGIDINFSMYRHLHTGYVNAFIPNPSTVFRTLNNTIEDHGDDDDKNNDKDNSASEVACATGGAWDVIAHEASAHEDRQTAQPIHAPHSRLNAMHLQRAHNPQTAHREYARGLADHCNISKADMQDFKFASYQHQTLFGLEHGRPIPFTHKKPPSTATPTEPTKKSDANDAHARAAENPSRQTAGATTNVVDKDTRSPESADNRSDEHQPGQPAPAKIATRQQHVAIGALLKRQDAFTEQLTTMQDKIDRLLAAVTNPHGPQRHKTAPGSPPQTLLSPLAYNNPVAHVTPPTVTTSTPSAENPTRDRHTTPSLRLHTDPRDEHEPERQSRRTASTRSPRDGDEITPRRVLDFGADTNNEHDANDIDNNIFATESGSADRGYLVASDTNAAPHPTIPNPRIRFTDAEVLRALRTTTCNPTATFKSREQRVGISTALSLDQRNHLFILPTGFGKSLLYMIPAILKPEKITIVLCPLVALMDDILRRCNAAGVNATTFKDRSEMSANLILTSTETTMLTEYKTYVIEQTLKRKLHAIVVEECHIVLMASHFRSCMTTLHDNIRPNTQRKVPIIALTATCPPRVEDKIMEFYNTSRDNTDVSRHRTNRPNLSYIWLRIAGSVDSHAMLIVDKIVSISEDFLNRHDGTSHKYIAYAVTKQRAQDLCKQISNIARLNNFPIAAQFYHADVHDAEKSAAQQRWIAPDSEHMHIMCATSAFGCGIDCPTVRAVFHSDIPTTLLDYAQESGRAGRDGLPAYSIVLSNGSPHKWRTRNLTQMHPTVMQVLQLEPVHDIDDFHPCVPPTNTDKECRRLNLTTYLDGEGRGVYCIGAPDSMYCDVCARTPRSSPTDHGLLPIDAVLATHIVGDIQDPNAYIVDGMPRVHHVQQDTAATPLPRVTDPIVARAVPARDLMSLAQLYNTACAPCSVAQRSIIRHPTGDTVHTACYQGLCFTCASPTHNLSTCPLYRMGRRTFTCRKCNLQSHNHSRLHIGNTYGNDQCVYVNAIRIAVALWNNPGIRTHMNSALPALSIVGNEPAFLRYIINLDQSGISITQTTCGLAAVLKYAEKYIFSSSNASAQQ